MPIGDIGFRDRAVTVFAKFGVHRCPFECIREQVAPLADAMGIAPRLRLLIRGWQAAGLIEFKHL